jgi:hypothetical protein
LKLNLQSLLDWSHEYVAPGAKYVAMKPARELQSASAAQLAFELKLVAVTVPTRYPSNLPCTPASTIAPCLAVVSHAPGLWRASVSVAHALPHEPLSVVIANVNFA